MHLRVGHSGQWQGCPTLIWKASRLRYNPAMRFSLKWLLAGTVYVAIAAAAFTRPHWAYSELLWVVTYLAIAYALIVAIFGYGRSRIVAGGFAITSALIIFNVRIADDGPSPDRLIDAVLTEPEPAFSGTYNRTRAVW